MSTQLTDINLEMNKGQVNPMNETENEEDAIRTRESCFKGPTDEAVHQKKQARRDREPLWYCHIICKWPKTSFGLTLAGHLMFVLISMGLFQSGYDILPITFDRLPLDIRDNVDYLRDLAWKHKYDSDNTDLIQRGSSAGDVTQPERSIVGDGIEIYFELEGGSVFTKENLLLIQQVENEFFNNLAFQDSFCLIDAQNQSQKICSKTRSVLRYFDGTYPQLGQPDTNFDNISGILYQVATDPDLNQNLQYFLGADAIISSTQAHSIITRSAIFLGKPLAGYQNISDRKEEQDDLMDAFLLNEFKPVGDKYFKNGVGNMEFFYASGKLIGLSISTQVVSDMSLAIGSFLFIILFMFIQIHSLWITMFAVLSIITGFAGTNIIYRCILDYRYFGIFHVLAMFIILGIGADDVFIFMDTWKESSHHHYKSVAHRLSDCYRKASMAMLFTSVTTALAFIVSASSPFLGIGSFGVFAGLLVAVNYISVIVFFPTVIVTYHKYFEKYKCCCCCIRPGVSMAEASYIDSADVTHGSEGNIRAICSVGAAGSSEGKSCPVGSVEAPETSAGKVDSMNPAESVPAVKEERRKNPLVRFFRGPYYDFVTHKIAKWVILAFFSLLTIIFIYFATTLRVNEEQLKFLKDSSNIGKFLAKRDIAFNTRGGTDTFKVKVVWGLDLQDLSKCHHTDNKCTGETVWDDTFNINAPGAQQAVVDLCQKIRDLPNDRITELNIQTDLNSNIPEVDCFITDMADRLQELSLLPIYDPGTNLSVPITSNDTDIIISKNPLIYSTSLPGGFNNHFEIGMSYWLFNGFLPQDNPQLMKYTSVLGEATNPPYTIEKQITPSFVYQYGTKLKFMAITINTTLVESSLGYPRGLPIRDAWEEFISTEISNMPEGVNRGFQLSGRLWHWLRVQETLTSSAVTGIVTGLSVALPILIIATHNVFVGILATFILVCITICVLAMIPLAGWKLGMLESLNLVLVVGLSVDYVVHLAEGYSRSQHTDRLGRTYDALEEVGISVLSGAVTTLGASMFLLFAQILFFIQFGLFMFCTILFSILYALIFFVTLIALIGPQDEFGSLKPFYRWCAQKWREWQAKKRENGVTIVEDIVPDNDVKE